MTTKVNERALVLEMLLAVNEEGQYSHLVLRDVLDKYQYLGKQERAFLTRLMEGTLERQLTLDYVIDQFSKTRVKKMKPLIRNLMRMSVYQIMYMDSVPDSAVCNEAVKLARKRGTCTDRCRLEPHRRHPCHRRRIPAAERMRNI